MLPQNDSAFTVFRQILSLILFSNEITVFLICGLVKRDRTDVFLLDHSGAAIDEEIYDDVDAPPPPPISR